ncbi:biotin transporter BioY [Actinomyces haliotis]|uniref:biotin transporter BioY n=1 Tax=Actinomyces haliotis TaxID=1280843 RepID=UPI00188E5F7C|nr:biotin transporter BioY [Actinomyces haliotis]
MTTNEILSPRTAARQVAAPRSRAQRVARESGLVLAGTAAVALIGQLALPLPFTPVPVTLGTLAALGVGGLLGSRRGVLSVLLLAGLAAVGAPVLAGWSGGVTASFGYVLGYALAAAVAGRATVRSGGAGRGLVVRVGLMLLASALVYVPGVLWLMAATGMGLGAALGAGVAPFLLGDLLKSLVAAGVLGRQIS